MSCLLIPKQASGDEINVLTSSPRQTVGALSQGQLHIFGDTIPSRHLIPLSISCTSSLWSTTDKGNSPPRCCAPQGTHKRDLDPALLCWYPENVQKALMYAQCVLINDVVNNIEWPHSRKGCIAYNISFQEVMLEANNALQECEWLVFVYSI